MATRILVGDCRERLAEMPAESVHCCVTSPPYYGLRDYGVAGQLGREATPDEYVAAMVGVFREVRRVLRADGTLWLNIGDSYAGSWGAQSRRVSEGDEPSWRSSQIANHPKRASHTGSIRQAGLKPKDLIGVPWMLAFALRADGWVLRQEIIWSKPNPMPESVTDRCTKAHESLFLFSKAKRIGPEPSKYDDIPEGEARWLAALFDGEGSLVCRREADKGDEYGAHAAQVSIGGTSRALIERLAAVIGEGAVLEREGQNAPMHYWQTSGKRALGLLRRIYPFLIVKQRQARCLIALEERKAIRGGHIRLAATEIALRDRIWTAVKALNHFGDPNLSGIPEPVFGRWDSQPYFYDAEAIKEASITEDPRRPYTSEGAWALDGRPVEQRHGGEVRATYRQPNSPQSIKSPHGQGFTRRAPAISEHRKALRSDIESRHRSTIPGGQSMQAAPTFSRNRRSVWTIATAPYPEAHFATFPPDLVEPCILAGTSANGVCPGCGAPWVRVIASTGENNDERQCPHCGSSLERATPDPVPAVVLDCFLGAGTTALVADRLGRDCIGIELSEDYAAMARRRIEQDAGMFAAVAD